MSIGVIPYSTASGLSSYYQFVSSIKIIDKDTEYVLAKRIKELGDQDAAKTLILSHLRFVAFIANKFSGYGLPQEDLIQEGNIGLMKAIKKFDPDQGVRLASFSVYSIKHSIYEYIISNWKIVKVATTKAQRKLFFNLRKSKPANDYFNNKESLEIADKLGVTQEDVIEMEYRLYSSDCSIDGDSSDDDSFAPMEYLIDENSMISENIESERQLKSETRIVYSAINKLDDRSRHIIESRWLRDEKKTYKDLSLAYGVSIERISQIEKNALLKLKNFVVDDI
jgi:RNA polymerase sigma-32 factor